jgi:hypothetical protein
MFLVSLLSMVTSLSTLPANVGTLQYIPGDVAPSVSIAVRGSATPVTWVYPHFPIRGRLSVRPSRLCFAYQNFQQPCYSNFGWSWFTAGIM